MGIAEWILLAIVIFPAIVILADNGNTERKKQ